MAESSTISPEKQELRNTKIFKTLREEEKALLKWLKESNLVICQWQQNEKDLQHGTYLIEKTLHDLYLNLICDAEILFGSDIRELSLDKLTSEQSWVLQQALYHYHQKLHELTQSLLTQYRFEEATIQQLLTHVNNLEKKFIELGQANHNAEWDRIQKTRQKGEKQKLKTHTSWGGDFSGGYYGSGPSSSGGNGFANWYFWDLGFEKGYSNEQPDTVFLIFSGDYSAGYIDGELARLTVEGFKALGKGTIYAFKDLHSFLQANNIPDSAIQIDAEISKTVWEIIKGLPDICVKQGDKIIEGVKELMSSMKTGCGHCFSSIGDCCDATATKIGDCFQACCEGCGNALGACCDCFKGCFQSIADGCGNCCSSFGEGCSSMCSGCDCNEDVCKCIVGAIGLCVAGIAAIIKATCGKKGGGKSGSKSSSNSSDGAPQTQVMGDSKSSSSHSSGSSDHSLSDITQLPSGPWHWVAFGLGAVVTVLFGLPSIKKIMEGLYKTCHGEPHKIWRSIGGILGLAILGISGFLIPFGGIHTAIGLAALGAYGGFEGVRSYQRSRLPGQDKLDNPCLGATKPEKWYPTSEAIAHLLKEGMTEEKIIQLTIQNRELGRAAKQESQYGSWVRSIVSPFGYFNTAKRTAAENLVPALETKSLTEIQALLTAAGGDPTFFASAPPMPVQPSAPSAPEYQSPYYDPLGAGVPL